MTTALRVTSTDPRLTRNARSWGSAEERARRVALLIGAAEIQRRDHAGDWQTVERFTSGAQGGRRGAARIPRMSVHLGKSDALATENGSWSTSDNSGRLLDHWELWFPARLGPPRRVTATVAGHKIKTTRRRLDLPPTMNDRLHYRVKGPWVREWREAARDVARERGYPMLARARVSMIVYRPRIGVSDPDNDWGRVKPLLDGLRDAGALAKDTYGSVVLGTIEERRGGLGIQLIVDEIAPAPSVTGARREGE